MTAKIDVLKTKNDFVLSLRDYLQSIYGTKHNYTYGEGDFEGKIVGGGYNLVRRDPAVPKDIGGFCFRKDFCSYSPRSESDVLKDIHNYACGRQNKKRNIVSIITEVDYEQANLKQANPKQDTLEQTTHKHNGNKYKANKNVNDARLSIKFGNTEYSVTAHIEEGYAGEISIFFMPLPDFSRLF